MSKKGRINRLVDALRQSGFYADASDPGVFTQRVKSGLEAFLLASKGKDVKRVVNALKIFDRNGFGHIPSNTDHVTYDIKNATDALIKRYEAERLATISKSISSKSDADLMRPWERGFGTGGFGTARA